LTHIFRNFFSKNKGNGLIEKLAWPLSLDNRKYKIQTCWKLSQSAFVIQDMEKGNNIYYSFKWVEVCWTVGKLSVLEQNPARLRKLTDLINSFVCTRDFKFIPTFLQKFKIP
jgi:hypothetical protein